MADATALSIGPDVLTTEAQPPEKRDGSASSFQIQDMIIRDADSGLIMWKAGSSFLQPSGLPGNAWQLTATLPSAILSARSISRELTFSTVSAITHLHVIQDVLVYKTPVEQWSADFGFVIPNSVNSWSHSVDAADSEDMLPVEVLSGNTMIETKFMDGETTLAALSVRLFYK
ncbi:hypothetical protein HDU87_002376 [Geranomyces variabilis]|uniref:GMP phosphodiesterase delta subunit domain-containing protein n=1 Tax=Geranomyces variabilis TaxID=109894 RepID=A0AAD5TR48_9FUNG|nr:hypothetical protein HDU87_002376 [Geranomyces variabilis]